ncbi:uncharacterized protein LOC134288787 [Aedes albopictus]|uniref:Endonuclease/exonuclease/phosphatase domain-containing protein n=1 Tax=Aedes albopictus TaxID=7160 RepID=A0ABM2A7A4_AEDAL
MSKMQFSYKVATINLNSSNSVINQGLLRDFVYDHDVDVLLLQEVVYEIFLFLPNHFAFVNISADNKGTAIVVRKTMDISSVLLEPNCRIVSLIVNGVNFVNVYGHSGSNYRRERNDLYTNVIAVHLSKQEAAVSVIGGDFNCTLEDSDSRGPSKNSCAGLKNLVELFKFKDVAKVMAKSDFTFFRGESAALLDRFYAPAQFVENVVDCWTIPLSFSDHSAVVMKNRTSKDNVVKRGRGYWKINPSVLDMDDVTERFEREYSTLKSRAIYTSDLNAWWNFVFKPKAKQFYKSEAWRINNNIRNAKSEQMRKLIELNERRVRGEDVSILIKLAQSRLMEIEYDRIKNYSKKLPESSLSEGEKVGVFQVSKQIHSGVRNQQLKLMNEQGTLLDSASVGERIHEYYQAMFQQSAEGDNIDGNENPLDYITHSVGDDESIAFSELITVAEVEETLKSSALQYFGKYAGAPWDVPVETECSRTNIVAPPSRQHRASSEWVIPCSSTTTSTRLTSCRFTELTR